LSAVAPERAHPSVCYWERKRINKRVDGKDWNKNVSIVVGKEEEHA
jgi:hypothetical protein